MAEHRLPIAEKLCGRARNAGKTEREWASPPGSGVRDHRGLGDWVPFCQHRD
jgi:hypothetical protein